MLLNYHPSPTFTYVQWSDIVADSISLTTYKVVLLSIGNKLRNGYNTTLKPHPATPTSWPDHFESGGATPALRRYYNKSTWKASITLLTKYTPQSNQN